MPQISANDIRISYDASGRGEPLVLVHGGWSDRHNWDPVAAALAEDFRVIAYDRRGHGRSSRPRGTTTRRVQEQDLAALIEGLGLGPAHVAGTSFGASIALGLATRRPDLVRSVVAHEPPLAALAPDGAGVAAALTTIDAVVDRIARGDVEGAARRFVEEVALGPGAWDLLPEPLQAVMLDSGPALVLENRDPAWTSIDREALAGIAPPVLLTQGDASPPWFWPIVAALSAATGAPVHTYAGAGHAPHVTHPDAYLATVPAFLAAVGRTDRLAA